MWGLEVSGGAFRSNSLNAAKPGRVCGVQPMYYHKSKHLNVSALTSLSSNVKFNGIEVDTSTSTIHVPTHVYDECTYHTCRLPRDQ